mmetsp:Transcript_10622/g.15998  ORF Transcript_10622/g.15998 Transcript_10622/m.15998 type:complete len:192 (+) Transcript_10622:110-685(+)
MYSNIDTDDVFSSAMEEAEIVENPFDNDEMTGLSEPLHAVDAARRLLGNDDIDSGNGHDMNMGGAGQPPAFAQPSNSSMGNSLLERIQQQKKQQNSTSAPSPAAPVAPATTNTTTDFGYPMVEEGNYSTPGTAATTATATETISIEQIFIATTSETADSGNGLTAQAFKTRNEESIVILVKRSNDRLTFQC